MRRWAALGAKTALVFSNERLEIGNGLSISRASTYWERWMNLRRARAREQRSFELIRPSRPPPASFLAHTNTTHRSSSRQSHPPKTERRVTCSEIKFEPPRSCASQGLPFAMQIALHGKRNHAPASIDWLSCFNFDWKARFDWNLFGKNNITGLIKSDKFGKVAAGYQGCSSGDSSNLEFLLQDCVNQEHLFKKILRMQ